MTQLLFVHSIKFYQGSIQFVNTRIHKQNFEIFALNFLKMKFLLFGAALASAREPLKWQWYNIETNTTTEYMAVLPEAAEYKNQTAAYKECQNHGMNLVTIATQDDQKNIMEKLKQYEREPAVYWISLDRKDKKSGWRWKYPGKISTIFR